MRLVKRGLVGEFPADAWVPLGHVPTKLAHANHLLFCEHNQRKSNCVQCGGREICPHQKRRLRCKVCQKANVEDRKRVKVDTDRWGLRHPNRSKWRAFEKFGAIGISKFCYRHYHRVQFFLMVVQSSQRCRWCTVPLLQKRSESSVTIGPFCTGFQKHHSEIEQHFLVGSIWFPIKGHWLVGISNSHRMNIKVDGRCHKIFKNQGSILFFHAKVIHRVSSRHFPTFLLTLRLAFWWCRSSVKVADINSRSFLVRSTMCHDFATWKWHISQISHLWARWSVFNSHVLMSAYHLTRS